MAGKTPKTATVKDEKNPDAELSGTSVNSEGAADTDQTSSHEDGTVVPTEGNVERKAVTFLGPYHRYSRGDVACFDVQYAEALVERRIAVWPEDAKKVLSPQSGASDHDTDIG